MKHIKGYKVFENKLITDIIIDLKDILLDLNDTGKFDTDVYTTDGGSKITVSIKMNRYNSFRFGKDIKSSSEYVEVAERINYYMKSKGYIKSPHRDNAYKSIIDWYIE